MSYLDSSQTQSAKRKHPQTLKKSCKKNILGTSMTKTNAKRVLRNQTLNQ